MLDSNRITSPDDPALDQLCSALVELGGELDRSGAWPTEQLRLCGAGSVFEWFLPTEWGGQDWSETDQVRGYLRLSEACLTTTFIITQRTGACRRLAASDNEPLKAQLLSDLASGASFATVGISHLTTSRRHLAKPALRASQCDGGYVLDGFTPWVTGGAHADHVLVGATCEDGKQLLALVPGDAAGVSTPAHAELVGLTASHTGPIEFAGVKIPSNWLIDGPAENIMSGGRGARTGGLQTSTLAVGLAGAAIAYLGEESTIRSELESAAESLQSELNAIRTDLLALAEGEEVCSSESLRGRANSLALRASQASLSAAKGAGYVLGHPAGRWCREALFFLVWSCPQPVMQANLCELAGIAE
jgi:alkylation response protein AidB-like acyl-CoA dehydrogenase